jgi:hypothetical protein
MLAHELLQRRVGSRIGSRERSPDHGDRVTALVDHGPMSDGVDPLRESADDDDALARARIKAKRRARFSPSGEGRRVPTMATRARSRRKSTRPEAKICLGAYFRSTSFSGPRSSSGSKARAVMSS